MDLEASHTQTQISDFRDAAHSRQLLAVGMQESKARSTDGSPPSAKAQDLAVNTAFATAKGHGKALLDHTVTSPVSVKYRTTRSTVFAGAAFTAPVHVEGKNPSRARAAAVSSLAVSPRFLLESCCTCTLLHIGGRFIVLP
jgi:hypothetical protein